MRAESFGAVHTISPKGAIRLMQIMPATWAGLRQRYRLGADPYDALDNIIAGAAYLRELHDRYPVPRSHGEFRVKGIAPGSTEAISSSRARVQATYQSRSRSRIRLSLSVSSAARSSGGTTSPITQCRVLSSARCTERSKVAVLIGITPGHSRPLALWFDGVALGVDAAFIAGRAKAPIVAEVTDEAFQAFDAIRPGPFENSLHVGGGASASIVFPGAQDGPDGKTFHSLGEQQHWRGRPCATTQVLQSRQGLSCYRMVDVIKFGQQREARIGLGTVGQWRQRRGDIEQLLLGQADQRAAHQRAES